MAIEDNSAIMAGTLNWKVSRTCCRNDKGLPSRISCNKPSRAADWVEVDMKMLLFY